MIKVDFTGERIHIKVDFAAIFVSEYAKVAKPTAFAAKRNVHVEAERRIGKRSGVEFIFDSGNMIGRLDREWRIVRDEVASDFSFFFLTRQLRQFNHRAIAPFAVAMLTHTSQSFPRQIFSVIVVNRIGRFN